MTEPAGQSVPTPIEDGDRVAAFIRDPAVVTAFRQLEEDYFGQFRRARKQDELLALHARAVAIDDIRHALSGVIQNGKVEEMKREQERTKAARNRPR